MENPTETGKLYYMLRTERNIGPYAIRLWGAVNGESMFDFDIVTVSRVGAPQVQYNMVTNVDLNGKDLTHEGLPVVIINNMSPATIPLLTSFAASQAHQ